MSFDNYIKYLHKLNHKLVSYNKDTKLDKYIIKNNMILRGGGIDEITKAIQQMTTTTLTNTTQLLKDLETSIKDNKDKIDDYTKIIGYLMSNLIILSHYFSDRNLDRLKKQISDMDSLITGKMKDLQIHY